MSDPGHIFSFYFVTALVLISALVATFAPNIIGSSFALFFTLLGMAGFYFLLGADFLALVQIIVYVGGILVLLLFAVLLTSRTVEHLRLETRRTYLIAVLGGLALGAVLVPAVLGAHWASAPLQPAEPSTAAIGHLLLTRYLLPFEFSSVILLVALIGASYLVRRRGE
jgi:NADH:ubiquinone oxidoreductase subunit 6 (subunit J)